jgi:hypothetical protein
MKYYDFLISAPNIFEPDAKNTWALVFYNAEYRYDDSFIANKYIIIIILDSVNEKYFSTKNKWYVVERLSLQEAIRKGIRTIFTKF